MSPPDTTTFSSPVAVRGARLQVSEDGTIVQQETLLGWETLPQIPGKWGKGYVRVRLRGEKGKTISVHKLVALAFHGPQPPDKPLVEHLDGSRRNNHRDNVKWSTYSDNMRTAIRLGERKRKYPIIFDGASVYAIRKSRTLADVEQIAKEFNAGEQTVRDLLARNSWRGVRDDQPYLF